MGIIEGQRESEVERKEREDKAKAKKERSVQYKRTIAESFAEIKDENKAIKPHDTLLLSTERAESDDKNGVVDRKSSSPLAVKKVSKEKKQAVEVKVHQKEDARPATDVNDPKTKIFGQGSLKK